MKTRLVIASLAVFFSASAFAQNIDDPTETMFKAATSLCDLLGEHATLALENLGRDPDMVYESLLAHMPTEIVWYNKIHYAMVSDLKKTDMSPVEFGFDWQAKCMSDAITAVYEFDPKQ